MSFENLNVLELDIKKTFRSNSKRFFYFMNCSYSTTKENGML